MISLVFFVSNVDATAQKGDIMSKEMVSIVITLPKNLLAEFLTTGKVRDNICTNTSQNGNRLPKRKEKVNLDCTGLPRLGKGPRRGRSADEVLLQRKKILEVFYANIRKGWTVKKSAAMTGYTISSLNSWEKEINRQENVTKAMKDNSLKRKGVRA
jgi:hypothetical protein